jgi:hypothetical protein
MVGSLPSELGLVTNLRQILLSGNENISGTIPSELGHMSRLGESSLVNGGNINNMRWLLPVSHINARIW